MILTQVHIHLLDINSHDTSQRGRDGGGGGGGGSQSTYKDVRAQEEKKINPVPGAEGMIPPH